MWFAVLGLLNGILMGLIYSVKELWFGVFFALVPFAGIMFTKRKISAFLIGYGLGYYIVGLAFLFKLTGVVPLPVYTANVLIGAAVLAAGACLTLPLWLAVAPFSFVKRGRSADIFLLAGLYTLGEWLQGAVPVFSFPWFRLSAVAVSAPILIQGASLFGGLFVSFLIMLWNGLLARLLIKSRLELGSCLAGALLLAMLLYGEVRLYEKTPGTDQVLVVQGSHEGGEKWAMESEDIFEDYKELIYEYADSLAVLVVLPETALPYAITDNRNTKRALISLSRRLGTELLVGAIQRETADGEEGFYNAIYHVTAEGIDAAVYRKQVLVPFGEYLPFEEMLGRAFLWLSDYMSGNYFKSGTDQVIFETKAGYVGSFICYESIFPAIARDAAREGAQLLVIASNDSWFQGTPAMREHYAHAILRAVEQDRYVIRAGNTGISAVIDNRGRVVAELSENTRGCLRAAVSPCSKITLYAKAGELFPIILCGIYILLILERLSILIFSFILDIINKQYKRL